MVKKLPKNENMLRDYNNVSFIITDWAKGRSVQTYTKSCQLMELQSAVWASLKRGF